VTEINDDYYNATCIKDLPCRFIGIKDDKHLCLKNSHFAPAIIQLQLVYNKEAAVDNGDSKPPGDERGCPGIDRIMVLKPKIPVTPNPSDQSLMVDPNAPKPDIKNDTPGCFG
jgi:hypothetical protein